MALRGRVLDEFGNLVFATKLAQVYPRSFCITIASTVKEIVLDPGSAFQLVASEKELKKSARTKREVDVSSATSGSSARPSGRLPAHGASKPLIKIECEPGQAIKWALKTVHPFTVPVPGGDRRTPTT